MPSNRRPRSKPTRRKVEVLIPEERISSRILLLRGQKVLLDADLAELYGVTTMALNQAVRRNAERFPEDFMFRLTDEERGQVVSGFRHLSRIKYSAFLPLAFTEQGVAMLSSVLRSPRAVAVNIEIMRAFVRLRHLIASSDDLARRIEELDAKYNAKSKEHAAHIQQIYDLLDQLMSPPEPKKKPIGFRPHDERDGKASGRRLTRKARFTAS